MNRLKIFLILLIAFLTMPVTAFAQKMIEFDYDFDKNINLSGCVFSGLELPPNTKIYAVGALGGSNTGWLIDGSGHEATLIKVAVNSTTEPVVLLLGAGAPTIWHIGWTEGSQIAAVVVSGYSVQKTIGLPPDVPVMVSTKETGAPCGEFYIDGHEKTIPPRINTIANRLFGREVDDIFAVVDGQAVIGDILPRDAKLLTNAEPRKEDFHDPSKPMFGEAGLNEALGKGLIRKATEDDLHAYYRRNLSNKGLPDHLIPPNVGREYGLQTTYVILSSSFVIPPGLRCSGNVYEGRYHFILPEGLPVPTSLSGRCDILNMTRDERKAPSVFECNMPGLKLPPKLKVFAAETYGAGVPLDLKFGGNDKNVRLLEVKINSPDEPAAIMLGTNEPTIWHFSWTKGTKIAALVISGRYEPVIVGLPDDVPILNTRNYPNKTCPSVNYFGIYDLINVNDLSRQLFKRDIADFIHLRQGDVLLFGDSFSPGAKLETKEDFSLKKFKNTEQPFTYEEYLDKALKQGLIRTASKDDVKTYLKALATKEGLPYSIISEGILLSDEPAYDRYKDRRLLDSYTIISSDFVLPDNLYPADFYINYILPEGMPYPKYVPANAAVYSVADAKLPDDFNKEIPETCSLAEAPAPADLAVYAGSGFLTIPASLPPKIREFPKTLPEEMIEHHKRREAELAPITVNSPGTPAALILSHHSYRPVIWHLSWTEGTTIAAVVLDGSPEDTIIGLPEGVPVLNQKCQDLSFPRSIKYLGDVAKLVHINDTSKRLFKKDLDRLYYDENNQSVIGEPLSDQMNIVTAEPLKITDYIDPELPWGGRNTLAGDLLSGAIRKATAQDMRQYFATTARNAGLPEHIVKSLTVYDRMRVGSHGSGYEESNPIPDAYMVLSPDFIIPATLYHRDFVPIRSTHYNRFSASASFFYPDGSVIRCSFTPGEYKDSAWSVPRAKNLASTSSPGNNPACRLPVNFSLRYKTGVSDGNDQIIPPDFFSCPAYADKDAYIDFTLPDGSITNCSYEKEPAPRPVAKAKQQLSGSCKIPAFEIPPNLRVYAAGARPGKGAELKTSIDSKGTLAKLIDVTVNSPNEPVALMLQAHDSTIWHLNWTRGTKISAVVVNNGFYSQRISGLPEDVPVLYSDGGGCPGFTVTLNDYGFGSMSTIGQVLKINNLANHLFKKDIDEIYEVKSGSIIIGEIPRGKMKVETGEEFNEGKFVDPKKPLTGEQGLRQALSQGLIRKATDEDYNKWLARHYSKVRNVPEDKFKEAMEKDNGSYKKPPSMYRGYVVLSPDFIVPAGLDKYYGSSSANFIVPEGIPLPEIQYATKSVFFLMDDGTCVVNGSHGVCSATNSRR